MRMSVADPQDTDVSVKPCKACGAGDRRPDGRCRPCVARQNRAYISANPEKAAAMRAAYAKAHPEVGAAAKAKFARENPSKVAVSQRAYERANAAKIAKRRAEKYAANIEERRARSAIIRANRRAEIAASNAKYAKANTGKIRAKTAKRHAAALNALPKWPAPWDVTRANEAIYASAPRDAHVDHIVPLQGAAVCGLHVPWNLQILPSSENIRKGNRFDQDRASAEMLSTLRRRSEGAAA